MVVDLFGLDRLQWEVDHSVDVMRTYQPHDRPYYGCFSGGKDSCVIKQLAKMAEVNVEWYMNVTTIDPPELMRFVKRVHPDVIWRKPKVNFFAIAEKRGFPTRRTRWCCEEFKESRNPPNSVLLMGVRSAESARRKRTWKEAQATSYGFIINPILNWSDSQVWQYIRYHGVPYCNLYDEGFKRLGCVGCPMARLKGRMKEFKRWPHFERRWKALFQSVWERKTGSTQRDGRVWFGDRYFENWEQMWAWWLNNEPLKKDDECQGILDFYA